MIEYLKTKLGRTGLPVTVGILALLIALWLDISPTNLEIILFKFLIFCPSIALVHVIRLRLFPYLDMSKLTQEIYSENSVAVAIVFFAAMLFYICMTYTLVSAI